MSIAERRRDPRTRERAGEVIAALAAGALALVASTLAARGLAGALSAPLPAKALALAGSLAILIAGLSTWAAGRHGVGAWAPQVALALLLAALTIAAGWSTLALVVAIVAGGQAVWALGLADGGRFPARRATLGARPSGAPFDSQHASESALAAPSDALVAAMTYERLPEGVEQVAGRLRVDFAAGQRTALAHVAFCPPLSAAPEIEWEQSAGPEARVQVAQRLAQGARFELKLKAEPPEPVCVWLDYVARSVRSAPG